MSKETKIQWCDSTINYWRGCTKVSAGCANCYAEKNIGVKMHGIEWGKGKPRVRTKGAVADALALNRKPWICENGHANSGDTFCYENGCESQLFHRRRIFSLSLGDWLDPEIPIEWLAEMLDTVRQCDQVIWILCTKRPELFRERLRMALRFNHCATDAMILEWLDEGVAPKHIWLLASVENQAMADQRIPELLKIPAVVHGLSCEPLLAPLQIERYLGEAELMSYSGFNSKAHVAGGIEWVIVGGESGTDARPCNVDWIRELVKQGQSARCATFVKQLGGNVVFDLGGPTPACKHFTAVSPTQTRANMIHPKGGDWNEWPEQLRVREFPS